MTFGSSSGPRVFIDTSVLVSAGLSRTGPARAVCKLAESSVIVAVVSESVLRELKRIVQSKFQRQETLFAEFLRDFTPEVCGHPSDSQMKRWSGHIEEGDWHVLAAATAAGVQFLVTHDVTDFKSERLAGKTEFELVTPGELLGRLGRLKK